MKNFLSTSQVEFYHRNGYLVLPSFLSDKVCNAMRHKIDTLVQQFNPEDVVSVFSTLQQEKTTTRYFLESGDKVRFFFEEGAFDAQGNLLVAKEKAINKIGHSLHDTEPEFIQITHDHRIAGIAHDIGMEKPLAAQSMYIFKQPRIGGEVVCHQDATFLYTEPISVTGFWFAIEDATLNNGCLWAIPGAHRQGLKRKFVRTPDHNVVFEDLDTTPFDEAAKVPLEVKKGTLIVLHGLLPHLSKANLSEQSRHAYAMHVISGACSYPKQNWLQRTDNKGFTQI